METTTDWLPGILALAIGLAAGVVLALRSRSHTAAPAAPDAAPQVRDLAAERDLLVARLREMAGATDAATARERYRLELEAARAWLDLDRERPAAAAAIAAASSSAAAPSPRSPVMPFVWGVGLTSAVFGLVLFVMSQAQDRGEGGSITGNQEIGMGAPAPARADPELDEVRSFAQNHPDSVDAQLDLAQALIQRDQLVPAFEAASKVLQKDPENPRGLTYVAVVRSAMGQVDPALEMLDRATKRDPQLAEAWVYRGLVAADAGRYPIAIESWEKALQLRPDGAEVIRGPLEKVKQLAKDQAEGKGAFAAGLPTDHPKAGEGALPPGHPPAGGPAMAGPLPPGAGVPPNHPPMSGGPPPATAAPAPTGAPAAGGGITGTIALDGAAAGRAGPGAILFVSVRPDGQTAGPPIAARRLPPGPFPLTFSIGPQDSMMGLPWPERATIDVRLDSDGNAQSRDPADPSARATGLTAGSRIDLVLKGS